jgi:predicted metal-dependent phosphoesterase TrpH
MNSQTSKADLHMHTSWSDGAASVPELLAHVAATADLRLIAITNHDSITGARQAVQIARSFGVEVTVGEEVSTAEGHLLALFIDTFLPPGRPAAETIAAIHAQGGLAIAPHPFDRSVPSLSSAHRWLSDWPLDAIEGFNAGVIWSQRESNRMAQRGSRRRTRGYRRQRRAYARDCRTRLHLLPGMTNARTQHWLPNNTAK